MEDSFLSRKHLDSLSTADLIDLAEDYGIDIPDDLSRRFIIGELLEVAEDMRENENRAGDVLITDEEAPGTAVLPKSYNDTKIYAVLRNPAWAFVFWDLKESERQRIEKAENGESLFLRVRFFDTDSDEKPSDSFDMKVTLSSNEQYVLIPAGKRYAVIDLAKNTDSDGPQLLASTPRITIPQESEQILLYRPGKTFDMSTLVRLSGMPELLRTHYVNYRQSFSD